MKIKVKDLEITLMKTDVEVIPSIINNENLSAYEMERLIDSIK